MNEKLLDYIVKRVDHIEAKIDHVDDKVNLLLKFKWQIVGGGIAVSAIMTCGFQIFQLFYKFKF